MNKLTLIALAFSTLPSTPAQTQNETVALKVAYTKGQKFVVTSEIEFIGDADVARFFGNSKLKASFDCIVDGAESGALTCTCSFRELSGKGNVKLNGKRWNYDLFWKTGSDSRKTVISHLPIDETEKAVGDLGEAFKAKWTAKQMPFEATLAGKTEGLSFLGAWMPNLFILPGLLPFPDRIARKADRFEDGAWTWTVEDIKSAKDGSKVALLAGKTKDGAEPVKSLRLGIDSRGFIASLKVEHFEKGAEKSSFRFEGTVERQ